MASLDEVLEARVPLGMLGVEVLPWRLRGHLEVRDPEGVPIERFPGNGELEIELLSALEAAMNRGV
jgi:hypothetical protein